MLSKMANKESLMSTKAGEDAQRYLNGVWDWLGDVKSSFFEKTGGQRAEGVTYHYQASRTSNMCPEEPGPIILVQQFYIPGDSRRSEEIRRCLAYNVSNKAFDKIVLLNERFYTEKELGVSSSKIEQIVVGKRLNYAMAMEFSNKLSQDSYVVLSNADIFFSGSINRVKTMGMKTYRKVLTQLRHEYDGMSSLKSCKLFGPRPDSQDAWIWNSKWKYDDRALRRMNIELGQPGCDNKIIYLFSIIGFDCYNEPERVKCYHYHPSQKRSYSPSSDRVGGPYYALFPSLSGRPEPGQTHTFNIACENDCLRNYVSGALEEGKPFVIPRIAGIENEVATFGAMLRQSGKVSPDALENAKRSLPVMKNNAGISLDSVDSICAYAASYLEPFHKCERYFWWEPWGDVVKWIPQSFEFVTLNFDQPRIDAMALDVFHSIPRDPWTLALKGKRILIISAFVESIKSKIAIRKEIYGVDLFPDCEFVFLKPPQTHGQNQAREFTVELKEFVGRIEAIKDSFDIALCSCGGYGNPVVGEIYKMGKSAIYVGGVLQMYFGIYGQRWLRERSDIMGMYLNKHWSRPREEEKPKGHGNVEGNCYW